MKKYFQWERYLKGLDFIVLYSWSRLRWPLPCKAIFSCDSLVGPCPIYLHSATQPRNPLSVCVWSCSCICDCLDTVTKSSSIAWEKLFLFWKPPLPHSSWWTRDASEHKCVCSLNIYSDGKPPGPALFTCFPIPCFSLPKLPHFLTSVSLFPL